MKLLFACWLIFLSIGKCNAQASSVDTGKVYTFVDQMPEFRGSLPAYIMNNLRYPDSIRNESAEGRIVVQFIVNRDGSLTGISMVRKSSPTMERAVLKLIGSMPKWTPGKLRGVQVRVLYQLPVIIDLQ